MVYLCPYRPAAARSTFAITPWSGLVQPVTWEKVSDSPREALPFVVFNEASSGAWVVDVSDWGRDMDRALIERMGDPVLVCFGTHRNDRCPLDSSGGQMRRDHGIVFEIVADRRADARLVRRFSELVKIDRHIRVRARER